MRAFSKAMGGIVLGAGLSVAGTAQGGNFANLKDFAKFVEEGNDKASGPVKYTLAVHGGYNSCRKGPKGSKVFQSAMEHLEDVFASGVRVRVVASCFKLNPKHAYFFTSSEPEKIYYGDPTIIKNEINYETSVADERAVYIVGHSYGGWLSMYNTLRIDPDIKVHGLATIDPISYRQCKPENVALGYIRSQFSYWPYEACVRAPADFTQRALEYISERAGWWRNFYQNDGSYLHSGPIRGARNFRVPYRVRHIFDIFRAHITIDGDNRVWEMISEHLLVD